MYNKPIDQQIKDFFKENKLGSVKKIEKLGIIDDTNYYCITCGLVITRKFMVLEYGGRITSVHSSDGMYQYNIF